MLRSSPYSKICFQRAQTLSQNKSVCFGWKKVSSPQVGKCSGIPRVLRRFPGCSRRFRRFPGCSRRFPGCSRRFPGLFPGCSRICFWVWLKSSPDKPKRFEDFHATHGTKSHQQIFTDATVCYRYTIAKFKIIFPICQTLFVCDLSFGVLAPK